MAMYTLRVMKSSDVQKNGRSDDTREIQISEKVESDPISTNCLILAALSLASMDCNWYAPYVHMIQTVFALQNSLFVTHLAMPRPH